LERAAELNANESSIYYQLARAYRAANRPADASAALAKLTALKSAAAPEATNDPALLRQK
jgi:predicted Zn-dependent protease